MEHSVQAYLQRQPTEKLIQFLRLCAESAQKEIYAPSCRKLLEHLKIEAFQLPGNCCRFQAFPLRGRGTALAVDEVKAKEPLISQLR